MKKKLFNFIKKYYMLFLIPIFVFILYFINVSKYIPNVYVDKNSTVLYTENLLDNNYKNIKNIFKIKNQQDYDKIYNNQSISLIIGYLPNNELSEKVIKNLENSSDKFDINFYLLDLSDKNIVTSLGNVYIPTIARVVNKQIYSEDKAPYTFNELEKYLKNHSLYNPTNYNNNILNSHFLYNQSNLVKILLVKISLLLIIFYSIYFLFKLTKNKKVKYISIILLSLCSIIIYLYNTNDIIYNNKNEEINLKDLPDEKLGLSENLKDVTINTNYLNNNNIPYYLKYYNINNENIDTNIYLKGTKIIIPDIFYNNLDIDIIFMNKNVNGSDFLNNINNIDDIFSNVDDLMKTYNFIKYEKTSLGIINGFTVYEYRGWPPENPYWTYRQLMAFKYDKKTGETIFITSSPNNYDFEIPDDEYNKAKEIYLNIIKDSKF